MKGDSGERLGSSGGGSPGKQPGDLSFYELVQACRNIGFDLRCGQCAQVFYTGSNVVGNHPHDEGCFTNELWLRVLVAISPLAAVAMAYGERGIVGFKSELDEYSVLVGGVQGVKLLTVGDALAARRVFHEVASRVGLGGGVAGDTGAAERVVGCGRCHVCLHEAHSGSTCRERVSNRERSAVGLPPLDRSLADRGASCGCNHR